MDLNKKLSSLDLTRRKFLSLTAKGLAGLSVSSSLMSVLGVTERALAEGAVSVEVLPQGVLVSNAQRCTGCRRCETSCSMLNDGKITPYLSRVKAHRVIYHGNAEGQGVFGDYNFAPDTCHQCKDAACMAVCPMKAIYADPNTGIRMIDDEKCVGCGACAAACPYKMPTIDPETRKSTKCIACGYCAMQCPTGALKIVSWEEIENAL